MLQMKAYKITAKYLNEMELIKIPDNEFKIMVKKILA